MTKTDQKILQTYKEYEDLLYNSNHKTLILGKSKTIGGNKVFLSTQYPDINNSKIDKYVYTYSIDLYIHNQPYWKKMFYKDYIKTLIYINEKFYLQNQIIKKLNIYFDINIHRDRHGVIHLNNIPFDRYSLDRYILYSEIPNFKSQKQFETIDLCW